MRWIAALYLFGFHPACLDRRVLTEAGPAYVVAGRTYCESRTCNDVTEVYERPDGVRYAKSHIDCVRACSL